MAGAEWDVDFSQVESPPMETFSEGRWYRYTTAFVLLLCAVVMFSFAVGTIVQEIDSSWDMRDILSVTIPIVVAVLSVLGFYEALKASGYWSQTIALCALLSITAVFWPLLLMIGLILMGLLLYFHGSGMSVRTNLPWLYSILSIIGLIVTYFWYDILFPKLL
jgi:hypothetical protein